MLEAIKYEDGNLSILDQLLLPHESKYILITNVDEGWEAIKSMKVRGAPAISIVAVLSLATELHQMTFDTKEFLHEHICKRLEFLATSRPTAVNLRQVIESTTQHSFTCMQTSEITVKDMKQRIINLAQNILQADLKTNKAIGKHGGEHIQKNCGHDDLVILTHCNTGSLATAGYGTALGVIRWLHEKGSLKHAYCTETRPYNQGARLTAYELVHDKIPGTLVCDSMVSALMKTRKISAVVVGADRVVSNGDTANKIGTYQIAISAMYHKIPFYVASPRSTLDFNLQSGDNIPIEERPYSEMTSINSTPIAAKGINCWNPAFDITPASLITGGIITECGVYPAQALKENQNILTSFDLFT